MRGAHSISTRRAYGLPRICRVWHCARSSVYARRQATTSQVPCRRRGPVGAAPDDVLVGHIRRVLEASPFHGEGYRKSWAKLRVEGIRTSQERVRRLMREHDLQAPHRVGWVRLDPGNRFVSFRNSKSSSASDPHEIEANQFAAALLMPEAFLRACLDQLGENPDVEESIRRLAQQFDVSAQAMTIRLTSLGDITPAFG